MLLRIIVAVSGAIFILQGFLLPANSQDNLPQLIRITSPSVVSILTYDKKGNPITRGTGFFY